MIKSIFISLFYFQQNNIELHLSTNDTGLIQDFAENSWNKQLKSKPSNNSDFNLLYLGFLNYIQAFLFDLPSNTTKQY